MTTKHTLLLTFLVALTCTTIVATGQNVNFVTYRTSWSYDSVVRSCHTFINHHNLTSDEIISITTQTPNEYSDAVCTVWYQTNRTLIFPTPAPKNGANQLRMAPVLFVSLLLLLSL